MVPFVPLEATKEVLSCSDSFVIHPQQGDNTIVVYAHAADEI